jgi:predicted transcriptional regulator
MNADRRNEMSETETMMLTARVPINLVASITNLAIDTGRTRTQVIVDALAAYLSPVRTIQPVAQAEPIEAH